MGEPNIQKRISTSPSSTLPKTEEEGMLSNSFHDGIILIPKLDKTPQEKKSTS